MPLDWIAANILLAGIAGQAPAAQPVTIETLRVGDEVRIKVAGRSVAPATVRYELVTRSGSRPAGNQSTQRGVSRLSGGEENILISITMKNIADDWSAILKVNVNDSVDYEIVKNALS